MRKNIFRIFAQNESHKEDDSVVKIAPESTDEELKTKGFSQCEETGADIIHFRKWLEFIKASLLKGINEEQKTNIEKIDKEIITNEGNLNKKIDEKETTEKITLASAEKDLHNLQNEINQIKSGTHQELSESISQDPLSYWIGITIIIALTFYLIFFYTSVIYNAFILDANNFVQEQLMKGINPVKIPPIINLKAIPHTFLEHGVFGVIFLIVATFMFIALGFLIHKFNEEKKWAASISTLVFTLGFDALLAYEIVAVVYNAQYNTGQLGIDNPKEWEYTMAFKSGSFYIIIMAGFAVYLIWGFVLKFIFSEREKLKPGMMLKIKRKNLLEESEGREKMTIEKIFKIKENLSAIKSEINDLEIKIKQLKAEKDKVVFNPQILKARVYSFALGWTEYINRHYIIITAQDKVAQVSGIVESFLRAHITSNSVGYNNSTNSNYNEEIKEDLKQK